MAADGTRLNRGFGEARSARPAKNR